MLELEAVFKSSQSSPFLSHPVRTIRTIQEFEAQASSQATVFAIHPDVS